MIRNNAITKSLNMNSIVTKDYHLFTCDVLFIPNRHVANSHGDIKITGPDYAADSQDYKDGYRTILVHLPLKGAKPLDNVRDLREIVSLSKLRDAGENPSRVEEILFRDLLDKRAAAHGF